MCVEIMELVTLHVYYVSIYRKINAIICNVTGWIVDCTNLDLLNNF